ncbi:MAG: hypothetical protein JST18_11965 [Bacteroidetes bacterium]|nr:hypothetical protein [Bacteroidota bacterium]
MIKVDVAKGRDGKAFHIRLDLRRCNFREIGWSKAFPHRQEFLEIKEWNLHESPPLFIALDKIFFILEKSPLANRKKRRKGTFMNGLGPYKTVVRGSSEYVLEINPTKEESEFLQSYLNGLGPERCRSFSQIAPNQCSDEIKSTQDFFVGSDREIAITIEGEAKIANLVVHGTCYVMPPPEMMETHKSFLIAKNVFVTGKFFLANCDVYCEGCFLAVERNHFDVTLNNVIASSEPK